MKEEEVKHDLTCPQILESTEGDHPDRQLLDEALGKAEELCIQVNEGVRQQENSERLEWLQVPISYFFLLPSISSMLSRFSMILGD